MSDQERGREKGKESGGKEGSGGGDGEGDGGKDAKHGGDGKGLSFGHRAESKSNGDGVQKGSTSSLRSGLPNLSYRDKLLSPGSAGFLVKHYEEDDIVKGWRDYFHRMNERESHHDLEESDEEDNPMSTRLEGKPEKLCFSAEEYTTWCLPWMNSLIIKVLGARFPTYMIRDQINRMWRPKDALKLIPLSNGYYVVSFLTKKIGNVPFEFYNVESLRRIGNMIGKMIKVDCSTSIYDKGGFARICVEIDLKQPLLPTYLVFGEERPIVYEGLHQKVYFPLTKFAKSTQVPEQGGIDAASGSHGETMKESIPSTGSVSGESVTKKESAGDIGGHQTENSSGITGGVSVVGVNENKGESSKSKGPAKIEWVQVGSKRKNVSKGKTKGKENKTPASRPARKGAVGHGIESDRYNAFSILQGFEAHLNNAAFDSNGGPPILNGEGLPVGNKNAVMPVVGSSIGSIAVVRVSIEDITQEHSNGLIQAFHSDDPMCE
ncbi:hypothetical protein K1719_044524 [Acacia pycnantha]|nr:hypothetical protein K1719_044524 [Acacia pycnantha]